MQRMYLKCKNKQNKTKLRTKKENKSQLQQGTMYIKKNNIYHFHFWPNKAQFTF